MPSTPALLYCTCLCSPSGHEGWTLAGWGQGFFWVRLEDKRWRRREAPGGCHLGAGHCYYWQCWPQVHCYQGRSSTRPRMLPQPATSQDKGPIECSLLPSPAHLTWHSEAVDVLEWGNWFCALVSIQIFGKHFKAFLMCYVCVFSHSVVSDSVIPWTGAGCHFLLQGIFLTQGSSLSLLYLLHWQAESLPLCHLGNPCATYHANFSNAILFN